MDVEGIIVSGYKTVFERFIYLQIYWTDKKRIIIRFFGIKEEIKYNLTTTK